MIVSLKSFIFELSTSLLLTGGCLGNTRSRRDHTVDYSNPTYTASYLRGVTISLSGADPNPETGAVRINVKQTYNWRRDVAGYGSGCTQWDIDKNKKSNKIGTQSSYNKSKYNKAMAFFQPEKATSLSGLMDEFGPYDDWSARVGDDKGKNNSHRFDK